VGQSIENGRLACQVRHAEPPPRDYRGQCDFYSPLRNQVCAGVNRALFQTDGFSKINDMFVP